MKTLIIKSVVIILGTIFLGCSKDENIKIDDHLKDSTFLSQIDSLNGTWFWYATYNPKKGIIANEYLLSIKIIDNENDSSLQFETYKNDTLLKSGSLNIYETDLGLKVEPCIIPFNTVSDEIYVSFHSKDSIMFYDNCNDCLMYYFTTNNPDTIVTNIYLPVFDSLQGIWNWTSTYDPKKGLIKNGFESEVHFLSVNNDSTINYETFKNDTLAKSGKLKVFEPDFGERRKIEPDILLHFNVTNENYLFFITKDSIEFAEKCNDCPFYYYVRK